MRVIPAIAVGALALGLVSAVTPVASARNSPTSTPPGGAGVRHFHLFNGSSVTLQPSGLGTITEPHGRNPRPFATVLPQGHSALRDTPGPSTAALARQFSLPARSGDAGDVVMALTSGVFNGRPVKSGPGPHSVTAHSTNSGVNAALRKVGAVAASALFGGTPRSRLDMLTNAARNKIGQRAVDLGQVYLVQVAGNPAQAARVLGATPGVSLAEPDEYVSAMTTNPVPLPGWVRGAASPNSARRFATSNAAGLPANFGFRSSLQSYLNANGVDLAGGYADIQQRLHQLPGQGEIITNVSLGDLTDESMAEAGDPYVKDFGPTTIVSNGQRYLDYPSLPLIPTYTVSPAGDTNPLGTVEHVDPSLGEVLLDFTMMAGLPHALQRPGATGSGVTDLLGIAPGASYRLVEPEQPTTANIAAAMLAAAQQTPRPDVINASLGFGTDAQGFPGRYLEDDPLMNSVVAAIVRQYGITVTIAANDGTRLFTPAPVGPDGGSTPTDVAAKHQPPTSVTDDGQSTTPSLVPDSGAIAAGGTTLDDTIGVPPQDGGPSSRVGTFAETRLNGDTAFSSGFGSRVNVSAPSDNIAALMHQCLNPGQCQPTDAVTVLAGGTSAAAPMTAAVAADVLQAAKATGRTLTPAEVRSVLERTGRAVPTQPQIDQQLHVGPQIDMTAAVESLLKPGSHTTPAIVRLSIAHRVGIGDAGATFTELANPAAIDLRGPPEQNGSPTGEGLVGPITVGIATTGLRHPASVSYALVVNGHVFTSRTPSIRLTPAELLAAAGLPLASSSKRTIQITADIMAKNGSALASKNETLTFGPTNGTHV
ncbi:MAG: S8 family serine peptidase, partial [Nocardiopsaceae bacterium]|nr:S8 family serine peptidase [Nocardiopsaceae bacterium]